MSEGVGILCFSPTGTSGKICDAVASGMGDKNPKILDMTRPDVREKITSGPGNILDGIDHLIVGAPVYFGKLPGDAVACLDMIEGYGKTATAVVVYGNRDYGFALHRMVEILSLKNFRVKAAGAFIGRHSYSDIVPVAVGRPDGEDLGKAFEFGARSKKVSGCLSPDSIPVQKDIFSRSDVYMPLRPVFIAKKCTRCGVCASHCPAGILSPETGTIHPHKSKRQCIGCMACVLHCKPQARIAKANIMMTLALKFILRKAAVQRLEPLLIFP